MNKQFNIKTHCIYCGSESFDSDSKTETTFLVLNAENRIL